MRTPREWATGPEVLDRVLAALLGVDQRRPWAEPTVAGSENEPLPIRQPGAEKRIHDAAWSLGFTWYRRGDREGSA
jgi:hypothetical protein